MAHISGAKPGANIKLGVDLIEKERFAGLLARPGAARRFTAGELAYAKASGRAEEALAAAFAAKEAFFKAASGLLEDTAGIFWQVELCHAENGRPGLNLPADLAGRLAAAGVSHIEISITHDRTQVLAAVLLAASDTDGGVLSQIAPPGFVQWSAARPVDARLAASWLPRRDKWAHKGTFGHVLVLGSSALYPGAAQMSAVAALKAGAGLVTLAAPAAVPAPTPELIRMVVPAPAGYLDLSAADVLLAACAGKTPVIGMGMGRADATIELCGRLFATPECKVIDADGLYALSQLGTPPVNAILTPHEGEMARLLGCTVADVRSDKLAAACRAAQKYQAQVVLKGASTLTVSPDGAAWVNTSGNPGMATGGSGDVLAGIIGAWLAQGMPPAQAAAFGVYLHGLAGDLAAADQTEYAMSALDIVRYLPQAYRKLQKIRDLKPAEFD